MQFNSLLIPFFIVIIFVAIFHINSSRGREPLQNLSARFNGRIAKFSLCPVFYGEYCGLKFCIKLIPANKSLPDYLEIFLIKKSSLKLKIYRENSLSKLAEKFMLIREVKVNDQRFDEDFMILSNDSTKAANHFRNENMKDVVRKLFDDGFDCIVANGRSIMARKPDYILKKDINADSITTVLQKIISFSSGI